MCWTEILKGHNVHQMVKIQQVRWRLENDD
jgi:hypothetical protein